MGEVRGLIHIFVIGGDVSLYSEQEFMNSESIFFFFRCIKFDIDSHYDRLLRMRPSTKAGICTTVSKKIQLSSWYYLTPTIAANRAELPVANVSCCLGWRASK